VIENRGTSYGPCGDDCALIRITFPRRCKSPRATNGIGYGFIENPESRCPDWGAVVCPACVFGLVAAGRGSRDLVVANACVP